MQLEGLITRLRTIVSRPAGGRPSLFGAFLRHRRASLPVVTAFMLIPITLAAGGAVDFIQHERVRIALQDALDRGVLAAASLTQTADPTALVRSYLSNVPNGSTAVLSVGEEKRTNYRKVTATASIDLAPHFLGIAGVSTLSVKASSAAQESRKNIEMSMVLDISGSMYDNGGMTQLRPAAKAFLDIVLKKDAQDYTSVSIVPFAGTVNLGYDVFNVLSGYVPANAAIAAKEQAGLEKCTPSPFSLYVRGRRHCMSSCFEINDAAFAPGAPIFPLTVQVPHFTFYNYNASGKKPWWCPTDDASVTYLTNDLTRLKARVDALKPFDGTGTAYGMKWAELLLNPSMQPVVRSIAGVADIPSAFTDRPAAFSDGNTLKFIVLMTDGQIGFQPRPNGDKDVVNDRNINGMSYDYYSEAQSSAKYKQVCKYARDEGITIFTIAFKVSASVAANIATCATDPSYAYKVDGLDMSSAFQSIATTMQKIKLVQ